MMMMTERQGCCGGCSGTGCGDSAEVPPPSTFSTPEQAVPVLFEYVYPDEDSGWVPALLSLATGRVDLLEPTPLDVCHSEVRKRVVLPTATDAPEALLEVQAVRGADGRDYWRVCGAQGAEHGAASAADLRLELSELASALPQLLAQAATAVPVANAQQALDWARANRQTAMRSRDEQLGQLRAQLEQSARTHEDFIRTLAGTQAQAQHALHRAQVEALFAWRNRARTE